MKSFESTDLKHLAKGDQRAFKKLFDVFYIPMVQRATFYLNDIVAAEDIVQETFTRVWTDRQKFVHVRNAEGYLFMWIRNECFNHIKRRTVIDKYTANYKEGSVLEEADPEPYIMAVAGLLERLPEKRKRILMMSVFDSKPYPLIAAELGISINTVKDHIKKAYAFLRRESGSIPYPPKKK